MSPFAFLKETGGRFKEKPFSVKDKDF